MRRVKGGRNTSNNTVLSKYHINKRKKKYAGSMLAEFEVEEEPDKEAPKFQDVEVMSSDDMKSDFEDEEIDEGEAFNEEDEEQYGEWFERDKDFDGSQDEGDDDAVIEDADDESQSEEELFEDVDEQRVLDEEEEEEVGALQDSDVDDLLDNLHDTGEKSKRQQKDKLQKIRDDVKMEAVPEGEFNLQSGQGDLSVGDLLGALGEQEVKKLGGVRKALEKLEKKGPTTAPLSKSLRDRETRKAAYQYRSKETGKWIPIVKANREVATVEFTSGREFLDHTINTTALAGKLTPQTELEKEVAQLLKAAKADSAKAVLQAEEELAIKELSIDELKARHQRLAKMKAQMFREETKAKRLKKIKSKSYRKRLRKSLAKQDEIDPEDEQAMEAARQEFEFKRAKERVTQRHKNTSRYIRRKLKVVGFQNLGPDERMQVAEQNRIAMELKRKTEDMRVKSDNDEASDKFSTDSDDSDTEAAPNKGLAQSTEKARKAALQILEGKYTKDEQEEEQKGLFALPFMKKAIEKKRLENKELANGTLKELEGRAKYDDYDKQEILEEQQLKQQSVSGGRMSFGGQRANNGYVMPTEQNENDDENEDLDNEDDGREGDDIQEKKKQWRSALKREEAFENSNSKEVKLNSSQNNQFISEGNTNIINSNKQELNINDGASNQIKFSQTNQNDKNDKYESVVADVRNDNMEMTQEEIIREAFAGDDLEQEFMQEKQEFIGEEVAGKVQAEEVLPGWGYWARSKTAQTKMQEAREKAKAEQEAAAQKRKDAQMKRVIISEQWDKKAASLMVQNVPFPHTRETFNAQLRVPIGKEYNTRESFSDFTRPEIVKKAGVLVEPIAYDKDFVKQDDIVGFRRKSLIVGAGKPRPGKLSRKQ